jgi:hypothetical protein
LSTDRKLAWISLLIGILGLLPWLFDQVSKSHYQLAILYCLLLILLLAFFFYTLFSGRGPHYETLLMKKILTLKDENGRSAEIRREQTVRARYDNLQGIWWKGNIVDGSMRDFFVDGTEPDDIETVGCSRSFYKRFKVPLSKGEEATLIWTFQADDSFLSEDETFLHETIPATRKLELEVNFPDRRRCGLSGFHVEVAGDDTRPQSGLVNNGQGKQLVAVVKAPKPGHTYRIDWTW